MDYRLVNKKIYNIIEMIKDLALLVQILQNNTVFFTIENI